MKTTIAVILFMSAAVIFSCRQEDSEIIVSDSQLIDSTLGIIVADTIIYDVNIVNTNPDDDWANQCLQGLDHDVLIDNIFAMIYEGSITAYDFETKEALSPRRVKRIENEEGFDRASIGMIQFTEAWYLDPDKSTMTKKVSSMVLGTNNYFTSDGTLIGPKALFRVELK